MSRSRVVALSLLAILASACSERELIQPVDRQMAVTAVSGNVFGPSGAPLCTYLAGLSPTPPQSGVLMGAVLVNPTSGAGSVAATVPVCPSSTYSFPSLADGTYVLRLILPQPGAFTIANLPRLTTSAPIAVSGGVITDDFIADDGVTPGGSSTLNGNFFPLSLALAWGTPSNFSAGTLVSGTSSWGEPFRPSAKLQAGRLYRVVGGGCAALGAKIMAAPPATFTAGPGVTLNCTLVDGPANAWTNQGGRLVLTPFPGNIGGVAHAALEALYGTGWGVQFPVTNPAAASRAVDASELFRGGLILAMQDGRILSAFDFAGHGACPAGPVSCWDMGQNAVGPVVTGLPGSRTVKWEYNDNASVEHVGLSVVQESFDGPVDKDYVLFRYAITNNSGVEQTFHAGFFMDWDLGTGNSLIHDAGHTTPDGRIMYLTNPASGTKSVGTFLFGATPVSGNFFKLNANGAFTLQEQHDGLTGAIRQTSTPDGDAWYLHGAGPITIPAGGTYHMWGAVLGGDDETQLLSNAAAAEADATVREDAHQVQVQVTGSPPVPGVLVTATNTESGEYVMSLTDHQGVATLLLPNGNYLLHARNIGDAGPTVTQAGGLQLALAPVPDGYRTLNTTSTQNVNHASVLYTQTGSVPLTPQNYSAFTAAPQLILTGTPTTHALGLHFDPGASIDCSLVDENGNPIVSPTDENVFIVAPMPPSTGPLPPLPPQLASLGLPRGLLTSASTIPAGSTSCNVAGVAATAPGGTIIETNTVKVNGEDKVFVSTVEVSPSQASTGAVVPSVIMAEPRRSFTHYLNDVYGDSPVNTDLGLVTGGWTFQDNAVTNEFVVAARFRGHGEYTLQLSYTNSTGAHTYQIRANCSSDKCKLNPSGSDLPNGLLNSVTGTSAKHGDGNGTVMWRLNLPDVSEVDISVFTGVPGRYDTAPDNGTPIRMHKKGSGNTWVIPG
jgi:hypothetical protein